MWRRVVVAITCRCSVFVITTTQLHLTESELRFRTGSNPACSVREIHGGEDLWKWSWLEITLNVFCRSPIPQKQFVVSNLVFPNNTILSFLFFFFFIIDIRFLIPAVIAQVFIPTAEHVIPAGTQTNKPNAEIET